MGGAGQAEPLRGGMVSCWLADFGRSSASGFGGASHEARRRMAVCTRQVAGSRIRPASREACRRAAVASRPACFPTSSPAPYGRGPGVRGYYPLRGAPKKKRATVPGPVWLPMVVPMLLISTLPFRWGKRASTSAATALASSMQADSLM